MKCSKYYEGFAKGFEEGYKKAIENEKIHDGVERYKLAYANALKDIQRKRDQK